MNAPTSRPIPCQNARIATTAQLRRRPSCVERPARTGAAPTAQVRYLFPTGTPTNDAIVKYVVPQSLLSWREDSNPQPPIYRTGALPQRTPADQHRHVRVCRFVAPCAICARHASTPKPAPVTAPATSRPPGPSRPETGRPSSGADKRGPSPVGPADHPDAGGLGLSGEVHGSSYPSLRRECAAIAAPSGTRPASHCLGNRPPLVSELASGAGRTDVRTPPDPVRRHGPPPAACDGGTRLWPPARRPPRP